MSRGGSKPGAERAPELGPDGCMGPSSAFTGKTVNKREWMTRTNSSSNMFSMLGQNPGLAVEPKPSRTPSRKLSTDMGKPEPVPHQLLPRTKLAPGNLTPTTSEGEAETTPVTQMSEADVNKSIDEPSFLLTPIISGSFPRLNNTSQKLDLSSLDILDIFRARLYLSRAYLITEMVAAI